MTSTPNMSMRTKLRRLTAQIHVDLETLWSFSNGFSSQEMYLRFLTQAFHVHTGLGQAAAPIWGDVDAQAIERARIDCLIDDLDGLHLPAACVPDLSDSQAWGVAYVLNGSCLGASVMLKRGDIPQDWPSSYLAHGRDFVHSGQFQMFMERLNRADIELHGATLGARTCFKAFAEVRGFGSAHSEVAVGGVRL